MFYITFEVKNNSQRMFCITFEFIWQFVFSLKRSISRNEQYFLKFSKQMIKTFCFQHQRSSRKATL